MTHDAETADNRRQVPGWPAGLASIGAIRFARGSANFTATVRFYRDLVGLPLWATFAGSYGSTGAIFGLPGSALTFEIVETIEPIAADSHERLCLYSSRLVSTGCGDGAPPGGGSGAGGVTPLLGGDRR